MPTNLDAQLRAARLARTSAKREFQTWRDGGLYSLTR